MLVAWFHLDFWNSSNTVSSSTGDHLNKHEKSFCNEESEPRQAHEPSFLQRPHSYSWQVSKFQSWCMQLWRSQWSHSCKLFKALKGIQDSGQALQNRTQDLQHNLQRIMFYSSRTHLRKWKPTLETLRWENFPGFVISSQLLNCQIYYQEIVHYP